MAGHGSSFPRSGFPRGHLDGSAEVRYSLWAYGLLAFYIAQGVFIMIFLRRRQESTPSFRLLVHSADVIWPALISAFAIGAGQSLLSVFCFRSCSCRVPLGLMGDGRNRRCGSVAALDRKLLFDSS